MKRIKDITKIYPDNSMTVITYKPGFELDILDKSSPVDNNGAPRNLPQFKQKIAQINTNIIINRSLRRSKSTIKDIVLSNNFNLWCTFTLDQNKVKNRYDINLASYALNKEFRRLVRKYGHFGYVVVPEYHNDGAIHFHALLAGYNGKIEPAYNYKKQSELKRSGFDTILPAINLSTNLPIKNKNGTSLFYTGKQLSSKAGTLLYNLSDYSLGFSSASYVDNSYESKEKIANYVTKYITKDMPVFANGKKRYWVSMGLLRPVIKHNQKRQLIKDAKATKFYENEYLTIERFNNLFPDIVVKKDVN